MTDKKHCPECNSGHVYVLVSGKVVCRNCGYDERKVEKEETK